MQNFVEGWTEPIPYQIQVDGSALDLSALDVDFLLYDCNGLLVDFDGTLEVEEGTDGNVSFSPAAGDLAAHLSPYAVRFKITSADGISFFPAERPEVWVVRKP